MPNQEWRDNRKQNSLIDWWYLIWPCYTRQFYSAILKCNAKSELQRKQRVQYTSLQLATQQKIVKQVAEKVEQSSTFRILAKPVAACNIYKGTCFATGMSYLSLTAKKRVVSNFIAGKKELHCELRKELLTFHISLVPCNFSLSSALHCTLLEKLPRATRT